MLAAGAGLISTFWLDTPFSKWFGYQVLLGLGTGVCFQVSDLNDDDSELILSNLAIYSSGVGRLGARMLILVV